MNTTSLVQALCDVARGHRKAGLTASFEVWAVRWELSGLHTRHALEGALAVIYAGQDTRQAHDMAHWLLQAREGLRQAFGAVSGERARAVWAIRGMRTRPDLWECEPGAILDDAHAANRAHGSHLDPCEVRDLVGEILADALANQPQKARRYG
jgi:hypothetical protein